MATRATCLSTRTPTVTPANASSSSDARTTCTSQVPFVEDGHTLPEDDHCYGKGHVPQGSSAGHPTIDAGCLHHAADARWNNRLWLRRTLVASAVTLALVTAIIWTSIEDDRSQTIQLETPNGMMVVDVANTPAARATGLSNRGVLQGIDGLLLLWDGPGRHPIWMARMLFSLDLVWLDQDGRVMAVLDDVPPCRAEPCPLYERDRTERSVAVLEMPAGSAASDRIVIGALVRPSANTQRLKSSREKSPS